MRRILRIVLIALGLDVSRHTEVDRSLRGKNNIQYQTNTVGIQFQMLREAAHRMCNAFHGF